MNEQEVLDYLKNNPRKQAIIWNHILRAEQILEAINMWVYHWTFVEKLIPKK